MPLKLLKYVKLNHCTGGIKRKVLFVFLAFFFSFDFYFFFLEIRCNFCLLLLAAAASRLKAAGTVITTLSCGAASLWVSGGSATASSRHVVAACELVSVNWNGTPSLESFSLALSDRCALSPTALPHGMRNVSKNRTFCRHLREAINKRAIVKIFNMC